MRVLILAAILFLPLAAAHTSFDFDNDGILPEIEIEPSGKQINRLARRFHPFHPY